MAEPLSLLHQLLVGAIPDFGDAQWELLKQGNADKKRLLLNDLYDALTDEKGTVMPILVRVLLQHKNDAEGNGQQLFAQLRARIQDDFNRIR